MKNKNASRLGKLSWKANPKTKEQMSEKARGGWTDERRAKQRERMLHARKFLNQYATNKQGSEGEEQQ